MKIVVTGGSGMVGRSLKKFLPDAVFLSSHDCDLKNTASTTEYFSDLKPDVVIHLAARVGGIIANNDAQYDFFYENVMINTNVIHCCLKQKSKLIALSSTCVYPKIDHYPITEDMLNLGNAEPTNSGYAYAKRAMKHQMESAARQYNVRWALLYATNLYGAHDHFGRQSAHVIPALLHKIHLAKNMPSVELYGTGAPLRQFLYVDDLSRIIKKAIDIDLTGDYNVVNPPNISILDAANAAKEVVGYTGKLEFNGKLDGIYRKDASIEKLKQSMELPEFTNLIDGLKLTYNWYLGNYDKVDNI